jgi:branched-chain amino acid transport system permease protein
VLLLGAATLAWPVGMAALAYVLAPLHLPVWASVVLSLGIVVPIGPYLYQVAFRPLAGASVLTLLIAAVAVHLVLGGLGLLFFGAEGVRAAGFSEARFEVGGVSVTGQSLWVVGLACASMAGLFGFFKFFLLGRALRATAINRIGARLVGIPTALAGIISFGLAGVIGTLAGILIVPLTTIYYDTGFVIGLKGFVAAILGGLVSYPLAALGALAVGEVESFASFWASGFKEVVVFAAIIPLLLVRSLWARREVEE